MAELLEPAHLVIVILLFALFVLALANSIKKNFRYGPHSKSPDEKFCAECGRTLPRTSYTCPHCGSNSAYAFKHDQLQHQ